MHVWLNALYCTGTVLYSTRGGISYGSLELTSKWIQSLAEKNPQNCMQSGLFTEKNTKIANEVYFWQKKLKSKWYQLHGAMRTESGRKFLRISQKKMLNLNLQMR